MPYITSDKVKSIRKTIKDKYPKFKFSITRENYSGVRIQLMESNIDFSPIINDARGCFQINQWTIKNTFEGNTRAIQMWEDIYKIANEGNGILVVDGDYGAVPNFYVWLEVGKWDKPYVCTKVDYGKHLSIAMAHKNQTMSTIAAVMSPLFGPGKTTTIEKFECLNNDFRHDLSLK